MNLLPISVDKTPQNKEKGSREESDTRDTQIKASLIKAKRKDTCQPSSGQELQKPISTTTITHGSKLTSNILEFSFGNFAYAFVQTLFDLLKICLIVCNV